MSKANPRASMFIASGYRTQQEADDAAVSGCKALLEARASKYPRGSNSIQCDTLEQQPRPGFGAIACNGNARCSFGYGSNEQAAREEALSSCAALAPPNSVGSAFKCSLGSEASKRDIETAGVWFDDNRLPARQQPGQNIAGAQPAASSGVNSANSSSPPSGSLKLLCQMQTGQSYIFVIDEQTQQVSVRNSTGQDWVTFKNGQITRQRILDTPIEMMDTVRVDSAAIRALRKPSESGLSDSDKRKANEFADLAKAFGGTPVASTSIVIDRNSGVVQTEGMGIFPNNYVGDCAPWSGRRF
ncbi:MAG: hypothetical protein K2Y28_17865 [Burkholderiaceae bacterium]|nr:hypothetical protein [Burkholderiaceae bacterium]